MCRRLPTISLSLRSVNMRFCKCRSRHGLLKTPCCVLTRNCIVFLCASNVTGRWMSMYSRLHWCGVCACIAQFSVTIGSFYNYYSNFIFSVRRYGFCQRRGPICVVTVKVLQPGLNILLSKFFPKPGLLQLIFIYTC